MTTFNIRQMSVDKDNNIVCYINKVACATRFISIDTSKLEYLTIADMKTIAYELYCSYYNPAIEEQFLSTRESAALRHALVKAIAAWLIARTNI